MRVRAAVAVAGLSLVSITSVSEVRAADAPANSNASEPVSDALSEVIVTATRQAQSVEKVPVSVAVFSEEDLKQKGVNTVDGLVRLTPGVTIARGSTSPLGANVTIR